jgi:hypothetical protein
LPSGAIWDQQVAGNRVGVGYRSPRRRDAVLIVDQRAGQKSSAGLADAARRSSGAAGGIVLCQVAVTLTQASGHGNALIGRALYLPAACAADEEHRELVRAPEEVMFAGKPQPVRGQCARSRCYLQPGFGCLRCSHRGCFVWVFLRGGRLT